jgi:predicted O-methyltransferase YrrM
MIGPSRMDWHRIVLTYLIQRDPTVRRVAEIGVYWGLTAEWVLQRCNQVEEYHLVDHWEPYRPEALRAPLEVQRIWQVECNKVAEDCYRRMQPYPAARIHRMRSVEASALFGPESLDLIFIDADHSEGAFTLDVRAWWSKVRPGGYFTGHDYKLPPHHYIDKDVARVVHKFFPGRIEVWPGWVWVVRKELHEH